MELKQEILQNIPQGDVARLVSRHPKGDETMPIDSQMEFTAYKFLKDVLAGNLYGAVQGPAAIRAIAASDPYLRESAAEFHRRILDPNTKEEMLATYGTGIAGFLAFKAAMKTNTEILRNLFRNSMPSVISAEIDRMVRPGGLVAAPNALGAGAGAYAGYFPIERQA